MTLPQSDNFPEDKPTLVPPVPWSAREAFLGVGAMLAVTIVMVVLSAFWRKSDLFQTVGMVGLELLYILPILVVMAWKKVTWSTFGLNKFQLSTVGLGCGLMLVGMVITITSNLILMALKIQLQAEQILQILDQMKSPVGLVLAAVFAAPISEELFFRGFLYAGLERSYGWKNAVVISSLIFALFHGSLASLVPTFILGAIFAFLYHQSKSIWPGIFLHFLNNAFSTTMLLLYIKLPR